VLGLSASGVSPTRGAARVPASDQGPAPSAARCLCDDRVDHDCAGRIESSPRRCRRRRAETLRRLLGALSGVGRGATAATYGVDFDPGDSLPRWPIATPCLPSTRCVNVSVWVLLIAATTERIRMLRNTRERWGLISQLLHWLVAVVILVQVGVGVAAVEWRLSPTKLDLFVWHKSVGMLILLLVLLRLGWRITNPTPAPPPDMRPWEVHAAHMSHVLLYLLVLGLPLTGWIINSAANIPLKLFWLVPLPDITAPSKPLQEAATGAHVALVIALAPLLLVHVGAALRHHYLKHNAVLRRMLPWTRSSQ
jgi:cytochrome b561